MAGLQHHQEFQEILSTYHVSDHAKKILQNLRLVLLIAPTSGGRNTIIEHQLKTGRYYFIVSDTTRPPRINDGVPEENGKIYWFRSEEEVLADLRAGEYLEAEIIHNQQVSGISLRELEKAVKEKKIAIKDIELEGMHNILRVKPDTVAIMVVPPSFDEWQKRLSNRGQMTAHEQKNRFQTAQRILQDAHKQDYYHFVVNENMEQSAQLIDAIIAGKPNPHQGRAIGVIQHLEERLQEKLDSLEKV
jgi:guanylate kinase